MVGFEKVSWICRNICWINFPRKRKIPEDVLASQGSHWGNLGGICARACHFSVLYSLFLYCIEKCRSYRLKSSEPCNLHMRMRKGVPKCEKPLTFFFCKSCSIFTIFVIFSTSTLLYAHLLSAWN
jgi:hypothetical protein